MLGVCSVKPHYALWKPLLLYLSASLVIPVIITIRDNTACWDWRDGILHAGIGVTALHAGIGVTALHAGICMTALHAGTGVRMEPFQNVNSYQ